jgi:hypothetical protein
MTEIRIGDAWPTADVSSVAGMKCEKLLTAEIGEVAEKRSTEEDNFLCGLSVLSASKFLSVVLPQINHDGAAGHRCANQASMPHLRPALPTARPSDAITGTNSSHIHEVPHSETHKLPRYKKATNAAGRVSSPSTSRIPRPISVNACIGAAIVA